MFGDYQNSLKKDVALAVDRLGRVTEVFKDMLEETPDMGY